MLYKNAIDFCSEVYDDYFFIVGHSGQILDLIKEFCTYEDIIITGVDIMPDDDEYTLFIANGELFVGLTEDIDIPDNDFPIYVFEDVNSKFWKKYSELDLIEVDYDENECDADCENCANKMNTEIFKDDDGKITGFSHSWSDEYGYHTESFYSSNPNIVIDMLHGE